MRLSPRTTGSPFTKHKMGGRPGLSAVSCPRLLETGPTLF